MSNEGKLSISLDEELKHQVKLKALEEKTTVSKIVREFLENWIKTGKKPKEKKKQ